MSLFLHSHTHCQGKYKYLDCTAGLGQCLLKVYPGCGHNKLFYLELESYLRLAPSLGKLWWGCDKVYRLTWTNTKH